MPVLVKHAPTIEDECFDFRHVDFVKGAALHMMQYAADAWIGCTSDEEDLDNRTMKQLIVGTDQKIRSIALDLVEDAVAEFRLELIKQLKTEINVDVQTVTVGLYQFDSTIVISPKQEAVA